ncbi:hypothetical protein DVQ18_09480 [Yersinia enterocolitica]|nr:hypothetical protein [Yersinia enterocolitica]EKN5089995.1 hypothetical protein [Yersinia enterocolitica]EKN5094166.1 hypothetical protein [Yersinia enterocolitica]EKN5099488.1 hypothetical protein [Yersinia enterocolitica]EKN5103477.1 hypothetical protein [Yersinia enterocolitica]
MHTLYHRLVFRVHKNAYLYSSYFKLHVRWLLSLTRIIDWRQLIGIHSLAACLQLELFRVYLFCK